MLLTPLFLISLLFESLAAGHIASTLLDANQKNPLFRSREPSESGLETLFGRKQGNSTSFIFEMEGKIMQCKQHYAPAFNFEVY